ncbi:MAG: NAD(P)/FAD-dependent oxidoreductase [Anaerolineae bacterium]|nr:NAD(P)/FAD-dependent oxidoreductase [Anaerolineae bacterium]
MTDSLVDVVIVGAGAAGLMAAIWAGRADPHHTVLVLDGAHTLGTKILASGGGRCNVTHDYVDEKSYAGSSRHTIRKVLSRFDAPQTVVFFRDLGVELKREETGKLFPAAGTAQTILDALCREVHRVGVTLRYPCRVEVVEKRKSGFLISGEWGRLKAGNLILATGGCSMPKSGSDGHGYRIAQSLGHAIVSTFPALVPLTLPRTHFLCSLSGLSLIATLELRSGRGKRLCAFTGSMLCTHFGISGPVVLDMSRHYLAAQRDDPHVGLVVNWLPETTLAALDRDLLALGRRSIGRFLSARMPGRLAEALCIEAGIAPSVSGNQLSREARKALARAVVDLPLPVTGNRGFAYAEVTAGGVPLAEIRVETMESRVCPGLYLCGEICDVDGQIGGYNFQWAWASGYVAGNWVGRQVIRD